MQTEKPGASQVIRMQSEEIERLNEDLRKSREAIVLLSNILAQYLSLEEIESIIKTEDRPYAQ